MESVLREFSAALLSSQKNNLDTPCHATKKQTKSYNLQNNSYSSECCSTEGNDNDISLLILTDSESRDKDDQSEPELDYEEELLSRRIYYDQYENSEATTPKAKRNSIPASASTPLASSTMIDDCSKSALRNNRRRTKRSNPIASSTMMEDLIDEVQKQHHETCAAYTGSVVTWSIDNSIKTESLENFYNIFSNFETENQSRNNNCQKKNSKCKQSVTKLLMFIKGIKRNLTRKTSSMNNRR